MASGNATVEKTVVSKANDFERTGLFWEITRLERGKEQEAKPHRIQGQILEGFLCRHCKVDWTLLSR